MTQQQRISGLRLFSRPPVRRRTPAPAPASGMAYMARVPRDLQRVHLYLDAGAWAVWIPAWRPESFDPEDGVTLIAPYGNTLHSDRQDALRHISDYFASPAAAADRDEMIRLDRLGGPRAVRRLSAARAYRGRVNLNETIGTAPWTRANPAARR